MPMGSFVPKISDEPEIQKMYKGCSVWQYTDKNNYKQYVMLDADYKVVHGTQEAMQLKCRTNLEIKYQLELVRKV